jgi:soluble lytic murein transglycosylase-like protein
MNNNATAMKQLRELTAVSNANTAKLQAVKNSITDAVRTADTMAANLTAKIKTMQPQPSNNFVDNINATTTAAPTRVLYNVPLSDALQETVYKRCSEYGIAGNERLVLAVMWQESNFNAAAVSRTNDYGLMQINEISIPGLRDSMGIDNLLDPEQNIHAGVSILAGKLKSTGAANLALMAYNMGDTGARRLYSTGVQSTPYTEAVLQKYAQIKPR